MEYNNIKTKVERIVYYNQQSKWGILSVNNTLEDKSVFKDLFLTLSGNFEGIYTDCEIEYSGDFKSHPKYGNQVELSKIKILADANSKDSIINFLSRSTIKGIHVQNALKIYNKYKEKSVDVVLNTPEVLLEINGIGSKTVEKVKKSIENYKKMEELINYCTNLGIPYSVIYKLDKELGQDALKILKRNVYSALDHTDNMTFRQIDDIALKSGVALDNKDRAQACLMYVLKSKVALESSTGYTSPELREAFLKEMGINTSIVYTATLNVLIEREKVILESNRVYLKEYYDTEYFIAELILQMTSREKVKGLIKREVLEQEMADFPFDLNDGQKLAIKKCLLNDVSVLTGAPGSGKSTITKALVNIYHRCGFNVVLLSPTGKATRRMEECVPGFKASTIHKFLKVKRSLKDAEPPVLPPKTVIFIDESSMLDIMLFAKLLGCVEHDTKIILIGDIHQLPSVQAGNILQDLIKSGKVNVCTLIDITRQSQDSNIIKYCSEINHGNYIDECNTHDFIYEELATDEDVMNKFVPNYIEETKLHGFNNVQVIVPYKKGELGTHKLNEYISDIYNSNEKDETFGYKLGDKVMQLVNNYDKDIFNGETGVVSNIDEDYLYVDFGKEDEIQYPTEEMDNLTLAYVSTTHKCQGSEYPIVFVILDDMSNFLLIRKILYTAISRGKKKVYLYSKPFCVDRCINNDYYKDRITKLKQFLQREN